MAIQLLIKGNAAQAIQAAHERGISLNQTRASGDWNETHARCASDYYRRVVEWFAEGPRCAPFPIGALLLFTHADETQ